MRHHPMVAVSVGHLANSYNYFKGGSTLHEDEKTPSTYGAVIAGADFSLLSWMRIAITTGYRATGAMRIPNARGTNAGSVTSLLFEFGKF